MRTRSSPADAHVSPRRVLLITIDTLRLDRLSCYDKSRRLTPTIDSLAGDGVRFTRGYAQNVITLPSHCNILTGQYPIDHGVRDVVGFHLQPGVQTMATILKERGFSTAAFVGAFPLSSIFGLARGFDVYDEVAPSTGTITSEMLSNRAERRAGEVVSRFLTWMGSQGDRPWFAWVHVYDPHDPYEPPEPFATKYRGSEYDGEVAYVDSELSRLVNALRLAHVMEGTVIVLTADHGEGLGDHGELTHAVFAYEEMLHVPLIILTGDKRVRGRTVDSLVQHVDIMPTVLDLLGFPLPAGIRGVPLAPMWSTGSPTPHPDVYFEAMTASYGMGWAPLQGIVSGDLKYIDLPIRELYDLRHDPLEKTNQAGERAPVADSLHSKLDAIRIRVDAEGRREAVGTEVLEQMRSLGYIAGSDPGSRKKYTTEDDPKKLIDLANRLGLGLDAANRGEMEKAIELFRSVIQRRPSMAMPYLRLAAAYRKMGLLQPAVQTLNDAIAAGASVVETKALLGLSLIEAGRPAEAIRVLEPALTDAPDDRDLLTYLGMAYSEVGRADLALRSLSRVLDAVPNDARAHSNLGTVYLRAGDRSKAIDELKTALHLNPKLVDAHNTLGAAFAMGGQYEEAAQAWKQALDIDPRQFDTMFNLSILYLDLNRRQDALPFMRAFVDSAPPARYAREIDRFRQVIGKD